MLSLPTGLIQVKEEEWTGFSEGWQGCSEGFPEGEAFLLDRYLITGYFRRFFFRKF